MTYVCPTCEYMADADLLKLQRLKNRVFCAIGKLDRCTPVRQFHMDFKIPHVCD
jgi:hypothetical protein